MNNEKIIAWAVMKDGECLSVRRFEPVASGEAEGVEFVPLVRFAEQPAQQEPVAFEEWLAKQHGDPEEIGFLQALRISYIAGQDSITSPPAQRTWVGLTDEEYDEIWRQDLNNKGLMDLTIAKLKEKNT